jgi:hypothetical protein
MTGFWELLASSVIVQATITLCLIVTICTLYLTKQPVPDTLVHMLEIILGFYMGGKVQNTLYKKQR